MKLLLDTHIWLWSFLRPERLSRRVAEDPADRFIAATAQVHELTLVTDDAKLIDVEGVAVLSKRLGTGR